MAEKLDRNDGGEHRNINHASATRRLAGHRV